MKIGIIKEGKIPVDKRVPLTPEQAKKVRTLFPHTNIVVESSNIRCFKDQDYLDEGIEVVDDLSDCDVILGVKEVPLDKLLTDKTYFFFSHTIKKQVYNRELLQDVLQKNIRLIDYETLVNDSNQRIIAFGRWAGIVGAYNGLWTLGERYNLFHLRRAHECYDLSDLRSEYKKINLPPIKIAVTGGGRVAKGAMEVLIGVGIKKVTPVQFLTQEYHEPVFVQLNSRDYTKRKDGKAFDREEFYSNPEYYENDFLKYAHVTDMLIASAFWDPHAPVLFHKEDITSGDFKISIVADITCDIEGSIPSTKKASTIDDPIYDYNPSNDKVDQALSDEANITVMAVDNLPCELPRDASESFGEQLIKNVLPELFKKESDVIKRATITDGGRLTEEYKYLQAYADGKE